MNRRGGGRDGDMGEAPEETARNRRVAIEVEIKDHNQQSNRDGSRFRKERERNEDDRQAVPAALVCFDEPRVAHQRCQHEHKCEQRIARRDKRDRLDLKWMHGEHHDD